MVPVVVRVGPSGPIMASTKRAATVAAASRRCPAGHCGPPVHAGLDPVTKRRHCLREVVFASTPNARSTAAAIRSRFLNARPTRPGGNRSALVGCPAHPSHPPSARTAAK